MNGSRGVFLMLALVLLFLLGPFVVVAVAGFSADPTLVFPPRRYGLQWMQHVLALENFQRSFVTSLIVGAGSTLAALTLGVPAAYALVRREPRGAGVLRALLTLPVVVPGIVAGLALLRWLVLAHALPVTLTLLAGHTALLVPYAVRVVGSSLQNLRPEIEDAAVTLGASPARAFFLVVLPNIRGGIAAAAVLSFITSFNQVPVSLFLTGPGVSTLPIEMLAYLETSYDPSIAALSTLLVIFTIAVVAITERVLGLSKHL
jgi:putative spermidine/putrescine transport system permease protein